MRCFVGFVGLVIFAAEGGYIDPVQCRRCHQKIFDSYQTTGMGRSFQKAAGVPLLKEFVHMKSGRNYSVIERGGTAFLRRTATAVAGVLESRIDYVIGSGNHSKSYVHRDEKGRLKELPLSWYFLNGGYWAMSPGYDRPDHSDFRREISDSCLFCHNGYPSQANGGLAMGIDCQRCHGPGEQHARSPKGSIVNPARLDRNRQLDVCLQCHLESASRTLPEAVRRLGREVFSFRPGERLSEYKLFFDFEQKGDAGKERITVNGAGYALLKSRCFQRSAMTCTTCHDPHAGASALTASRYNSICRSCHTSAHKAAKTNCLGCHMPKRRTEDAVHVVMTDHLIRRTPPAVDPVAPVPETHKRQTGRMRPLYPPQLADSAETRLYVALAQLRASDDLLRDTARLRRAIGDARPTAAEPYRALGEAYGKIGQVPAAIDAFRSSLDREPQDVSALVATAALLGETGRAAEALKLIESAVRRLDTSAPLWNSLSVIYVQLQRFDEALNASSRALQLDSGDPIAWLNAGVCMQASGDKKGAEAAYRQALLLQPDLARARKNLELLLKN